MADIRIPREPESADDAAFKREQFLFDVAVKAAIEALQSQIDYLKGQGS